MNHNLKSLHKFSRTDASHPNLGVKALFHVILINIAKVRRCFKISMSNWAAKNISKRRLINFFGLYRLIPTPKYLNHSILNNELSKSHESLVLGLEPL